MVSNVADSALFVPGERAIVAFSSAGFRQPYLVRQMTLHLGCSTR